MFTLRAPHLISLALLLLAGLVSPISARAQSTPLPAASEPDKTTDPALKGPTIGDRNAPKGKAQSGFGPDSIEKKKQGGKKPSPPMSMVAFLKSLDVLRAAPTPDNAGLSTEQDAKIKAIASDFDSSTRQYMDKNQQEIDSLRASLSPTDRNMLDQQLARGGQIKLSKSGFGGKGAVQKEKAKAKKQGADASATASAPTTIASKDQTATTRTRLVEIYAGRPKSEDAQAKILGILAPDQLAIVDQELAKHDATSERKHGKGGRAKKAT